MTTEYEHTFRHNYSLADPQKELLTDILQHKRKKWIQKQQ